MIEPHCLTNDGSQADLYFRLTSSTWGNGFVGFHGIPPPSGYRCRPVDGPERSAPGEPAIPNPSAPCWTHHRARAIRQNSRQADP
jgi:hypothetical protein